MRTRLLSLLTVGVIVLTGTPARADYQFTFDASSYSVNVGQTVNVEVFLTQTGNTTGLSTVGLNQGGVQLSYNAAIANVTGVTANDSAATPAGPFSPVQTTTNIGNGNAALTVGYANSTSGATGTSVLLGTFSFTGVSAGSTVTLTADPYPGQPVNVLANGQVIDDMIANSTAVITVTAVPEPGSLVLGGLLATGIAGRSLRRLRRTPVTA